MKLTKSKLIMLSFVGLTTCSGLVLASTRTYADNDSATDEVNITVPVACTMTGTIATGQEHIATLQPGTYSGASGSTYENGIGKTTLATFCNDYNGFSIYAIGFTGEIEGDNTLIGTSASGSAIIPTKVYESTDTTSNWSMKVTKDTDASTAFNPANMNIANSFDSWHTIPDDYTRVAEYHASTGSSATDQSLGAKVETTYAAFVSTSQPADTYTGKVKYVMVHPYFQNEATDPEKPERLEPPLSRCATPLSREITGINYMQDIDSTNISTILSVIDEGNQYFLRDIRDNQPYCISKLKDGKLWMTENLNLAGGTALSAEDTDVTSSYIDNFTTSNKLAKTGNAIILPTSSTSGFNSTNYSYVYNSDNKENCGADGQNTPCYSYYSWDAATLGSGRAIGIENTDAVQSICPKGWQLPRGRTTSASSWQTESDFYVLAHQYGLDSTVYPFESDDDFFIQAGPGTIPNFLLAGEYSQGSLNGVGTSGSYWGSSAANNTIAANKLSFSNGYVGTNGYGNRSIGLSVRCLFSEQ